MSERDGVTTNAGQRVGAGFLLIVAASALITLAAAWPGFRSVALWILLAPVNAIALLLPGEGRYENAVSAARVLGWVGWALSPVLAAPILLAALNVWSPRGRPGDVTRRAAGVITGLAARTERALLFVGDLVSAFAVALVAVVSITVIQSAVFGIAFTKLQELVIYLHAAAFMLASAATLLVDGHVRVDVLYGRLSNRGKALINLVGFYALLTPAMLVVLVYTRPTLNLAWRSGKGSLETDGLPIGYLLTTLIPVFAVMMLAAGWVLAVRAAAALKRGEA